MDNGDWYRTWAFKINEKLAKREGYEMQSISGSLTETANFPGCLYWEAIGSINVVLAVRLYAGTGKICE